MNFLTVGPVLENTDREEATAFLHGFDFSDCETQEDDIAFSEHVTTFGDIEMRYDYAGDYFFFVKIDQSNENNNA